MKAKPFHEYQVGDFVCDMHDGVAELREHFWIVTHIQWDAIKPLRPPELRRLVVARVPAVVSDLNDERPQRAVRFRTRSGNAALAPAPPRADQRPKTDTGDCSDGSRRPSSVAFQ